MRGAYIANVWGAIVDVWGAIASVIENIQMRCDAKANVLYDIANVSDDIANVSGATASVVKNIQMCGGAIASAPTDNSISFPITASALEESSAIASLIQGVGATV